MYYFENDEPESCIGFIFTESCSIESPSTASPREDSFEEHCPFIINTLGCRKYVLYALNEEDRTDWINAIEDNKILNYKRYVTSTMQTFSRAHYIYRAVVYTMLSSYARRQHVVWSTQRRTFFGRVSYTTRCKEKWTLWCERMRQCDNVLIC